VTRVLAQLSGKSALAEPFFVGSSRQWAQRRRHVHEPSHTKDWRNSDKAPVQRVIVPSNAAPGGAMDPDRQRSERGTLS
jgi:hypothetical protein